MSERIVSVKKKVPFVTCHYILEVTVRSSSDKEFQTVGSAIQQRLNSTVSAAADGRQNEVRGDWPFRKQECSVYAISVSTESPSAADIHRWSHTSHIATEYFSTERTNKKDRKCCFSALNGMIVNFSFLGLCEGNFLFINLPHQIDESFL